MKFSSYFIDRPVFASVLSAFILIAGAISLFKLPISEYPEVVPPSVVVRAAYPGANPKVISETVAAPLEQEIVGVENMLYMSSQATIDGSLALTVTFRIGTDIDRAQVQVQNRVAQALPRLPEEVRAIGVSTLKSSPAFLMVVHLTSPDGRYDSLYLRNYATLNVRDTLARLNGVGDVRVFGAGDYAMRVWLDPQKMSARDLTTGDVVGAIREQNLQVAAGQIGAPPAEGSEFQLALNTQGRLENEEEFGEIVVKTGQNGEVVRLRDIARLELGAATYATQSLLGNENAVAIPVYQAPGSNALELSNKVRADMETLKKSFPQGMDYKIIYDPTQFVRQSIDAVVETLLEAVLLVVLVVILFLQTWRASIIPLVAVPVSVIGTFAVLYALGFSINTLSLFGLVLAIGIVVDDSIVVVENVERHIANGLKPLAATKKAMSEVSRPIIAITLVLCAVFIPVAFVEGLTGEFYRQFALTIAISTVISAFNSLTLSPALAALLLKPHDARPDASRASTGSSRAAAMPIRAGPRGPSNARRSRSPCTRGWWRSPCSASTRRRRDSSRSRTSCTSWASCSCRPRHPSTAPTKSCAAWARSPSRSRACSTPCSSPACRRTVSRRSRARRWCSSRSRISTSAKACPPARLPGRSIRNSRASRTPTSPCSRRRP
jgi:multidrug efflux pump